MSIGGNAAGINFSGLGSGIDTNSIVERLILLEQLPIRRLQQQQAALTQRMGVYNQLRGRIQAVSTAAATLNSASAYNPARASSSDTGVATITASSGAVNGTYSLSVSQLAQAQKLGSSAQASASEALSLSGSFVVGGKTVEVAAGDSLLAIAQKVNSAGAGVTASVIDGGPGAAYLSFTASKTGRNQAISLSDTSGGVLQSLGFLDTAIRHSITGGAASFGFSSPTKTIGEMANLNGWTEGTVAIGEGQITVSSSDTLTSIAAKINAASLSGVSASVVSQTVHGETTHRLEVTGTTDFGTEGDLWLNLGVLKREREIVAAQDAKFRLDSVALSSETNVITSVIPNVTLTLLKANASEPATSTLSITRDTEQTKKSIKGFMDAYNQLVDFVQQNSALNKETFQAGVLFGDAVSGQIESTLSSLLFDTLPNLTGPYRNLSQIGFAFDDKGKLKLDETILDEAIATNPDAIGALMRATGTSTDNRLTFVTAGPATRSSGPSGYEVEITRLATKTTFTGSIAQTSGNIGGETLTFSGALVGSDYQLVIPTGYTAAQTRDLINADTKLKDLVTAELVDGKLFITSKRWGSPGLFDVVSNLEAADDNSGIGMGDSKGTLVEGLDVAGNINGQAATGSGQFLTAASQGDNKDADGLQVQYTGTELGVIGSIIFSKGVAARAIDLISTFTDTVNGLLTSTDKTLQSQFDDLGATITSLSDRISLKELDLRRRFAAMEQAISALQQQQVRLSSILTNSSQRR